MTDKKLSKITQTIQAEFGTDLMVFGFLFMAWSFFMILKVSFENNVNEISLWKRLMFAYIKTSLLFAVVWLLYAATASQHGHDPWPLNLVF